MIKKCTCRSDRSGNTNGANYQDKKYGYGNRVHNVCKTEGGTKKHRCTVCGYSK